MSMEGRQLHREKKRKHKEIYKVKDRIKKERATYTDRKTNAMNCPISS